MSDAPYVCDDDDRRRAVRAEATINGIDFLEVDESQTQIEITFIHPLPGEAGETASSLRQLFSLLADTASVTGRLSTLLSSP